jgi:hypothetical protein
MRCLGAYIILREGAMVFTTDADDQILTVTTFPLAHIGHFYPTIVSDSQNHYQIRRSWADVTSFGQAFALPLVSSHTKPQPF